jgi:hypothetical protein
LPACDRKVSFDPYIRSHILPFSPANAIDRDWPMIAGRPKYFSKLDVIRTSAVEVINSLNSSFVFLLKNIEVFSRFNFCPEAFSYTSRISCTLPYSMKFALQNNKLSSTKKRGLIFVPPFAIGKPEILPSRAALCISVLSPFAHKIKRYGESGSPCLIPQDGLM